MRRNFAAFFVAFICMPFFVQAGGLMTNTNQSASYIRMPVLDAVVGPEGAYYNPAGLAFLDDGLHFSISNQTITQKRTINSTYPGMNRSEFEGTVSAPLFPSVYGTYKRDRFAISFGVNPIGGGGSALFEDGLPSFEQQVAVLPGMLTQAGIPTTQYDFDTKFDAQSLFWGFQANASYALNDLISVSAGLRYVTATNSYSGHLTNIQFNPTFPILGYNGTQMISAPGFFGEMAGIFGQLAGIAATLQPIVGTPYEGLTLTQAVAGGLLSAEDALAIAGGFALVNPLVNPSTLTLGQLQGAYQMATPGLTAQQNAMLGYQAMTSDKEVDVIQRGSSLAPIFGVHLQLSERINLAVKYEHKTPLKVKNETKTDNLGMYPDGQETANNLPSMLSVGGSFGLTDQLTINTGVHYYFDKSADYGKSLPNDEIIDNNFFEAGLGVEYKINRNFLFSAGYLRTQTGVNELYHSDMSHSLTTNTFGAGMRVQLTNLFAFNLGALYSQYISHTKDFPTHKETYDRSNLVFALGVDLKL